MSTWPTPILEAKNWPVCKIVLMVNYFGFEQNFTPFKNYQKSLRGAFWAPGWPQGRAKSGMGST